MYLLDTDVVSQPTKNQPVQAVMAWLKATPPGETFLSVITIEEVRAGAESMPLGRRRSTVEEWLEHELKVGFADRILPVTVEIADLCGRLIVAAQRRGHTASLDDVLIAATAQVHGLKLATLNRKHFQLLGVEMVDL